MTLTTHQSAEAFRLAALGYGYDDICVKLEIHDADRRDRIRRIVLRKPMPKPKFSDQMAKARDRNIRRQLSVRGREEAADARRDVPITLPTLSILRNECGND